MTLYSGVKEVLCFERIDDLFYDKELPLSALGYDTELTGGNLHHLEYYPNMGLILKYGTKSALAVIKGNKIKLLDSGYAPCKIQSKNVYQRFALNLLNDSDSDLVTITGKAGSGKTLLALAHAMQLAKQGKISKVIIAKSMVPVGREIGFLKGDFAEKIRPWLGNFYDNLEVLGYSEEEIDMLVNDPVSARKLGAKIEIAPLTFIQGRSLSNAVVIIDEAQNLSKDVVKQIITRPAENCKLILLGDVRQIFERGVTEDNNGLSWVVERGKEASMVGHIDLPQVERSRLAKWAAELE